MIDYRFLWGAIAIMLIIIAREFLRKKYNFDMDSIDVQKTSKNITDYLKFMLKPTIKSRKAPQIFVINRSTGDKCLTLVDAGVNKVTVLTTLRQITDISLDEAKSIVDNAPCKFMMNISDKEADLTKKALEFVGATVEIK